MELYYLILTGASIIVGFAMHRSDFCISGAFRDFWLFKRTTYLKAIFISISLNLILFQIFYQTGIITYMPYPLLSGPNLGNIVGGFIFGIGMVCAGSCVVGVLYKMGAGSFIAFIGFLGIISGSGIYVLYSDYFNIFKNYLALSSLTVPQLLGCNPSILKLIVIVPLAGLIFKWFKENDFRVKSFANGFINPFLAGIIISFGSLISYIVAGMPIGVTTTYSKLSVYFLKLFNNDFISNLNILHKTPLNFYNYFLEKKLIGGIDSAFDGVTIVQLPIIVGIILGSFISALSLNEFNFYFKIPLRQYVVAFVGGTLMGLGARMGSGCNIWHIFGGLSILAINAIFFVAGLFIGSFVGSLIIKRVLH